MAELIAERPLAGYDQMFGPVRLSAPPDLALVALAVPLGGEAAAEKAIRAAWGVGLPAPGHYATARDGTRLIRMGPDQAMVLFAHAAPDAEALVREKIGEAAYLTDQSDVWVGLEIAGPGAPAALERICPLDLHPSVFGPDAAARTIMEHLGAVILRTGDGFLLLSAASSALSFLDAVETSIRNTA